MSPRKRAGSRKNWPDHLHCRDGYWSWRDPLTGKEHGLGRDKANAFSQAIEANLHIANLREKPRLIDRLRGSSDRSTGAWLTRYEEVLAARDLAENTRRSYKSLLKRARVEFPAHLPLASIEPASVTDKLRAIAADKARTAQAYKGFLRDVFEEAIAAGWIDDNPVRAAKLPAPKIRRSRLTLEAFQAIHGASRQPWLRNAMALRHSHRAAP